MKKARFWVWALVLLLAACGSDDGNDPNPTPEPPQLETIAAIASADDELSSLLGSLSDAQVALLSDESQTLTVLAPINEAFAEVSDVLATLSAEQVATVINYHVLSGEFLAADVIALDGGTLPGTDITVSVEDGVVLLQGSGNDAPVEVIDTDIEASNGIIHVLDGILLPAGLITDPNPDPDPDPDPNPDPDPEPEGASISGRVFNDVNQNDIQDAGEAGLADFTVTAFVDGNGNGMVDAGEASFSATSDASGAYTITGLAEDATYVVTQDLPFGWRNVASNSVPLATQVIGGGDADIAEYPFKVALISDADAPFDSQSCGATLLSDQWVLTAAHCFGNDAGDAVVGDQFVADGLFAVLNASTLEPGNGQIVQVTDIISHPLYLNNPLDDPNMYDVALLRLAERVPYPTVTIATEADQAASGIVATGVGWGTILFQGSDIFGQTIQEVTLPLLSNEDCLPLIDEGDLSLDNLVPQLCAGRPTGGVDTCQGDSGGALLVRNETNTGWLQVGLSSWGAGCGYPGSPGVYARMDVLDDWIFANAREDGGSVSVNLAATPNATANFGNVSTINPQEDDGSLFFVHDFDIAPTPIREVPAGEPLTFRWEIVNTDSDKVCRLEYISVDIEEFEEDGEAFFEVSLGEDVTPIATVDPCVPGENTADFAGFGVGSYNVTLTVEGDNKTRTRTLLLGVE